MHSFLFDRYGCTVQRSAVAWRHVSSFLASFKWLLLCKQIAAHSQLTLTTSTLIPEWRCTKNVTAWYVRQHGEHKKRRIIFQLYCDSEVHLKHAYIKFQCKKFAKDKRLCSLFNPTWSSLILYADVPRRVIKVGLTPNQICHWKFGVNKFYFLHQLHNFKSLTSTLTKGRSQIKKNIWSPRN